MPKLNGRTDSLQQLYTDERDDSQGIVYIPYLRQSTENDQGASFEDQYRDCLRAVNAKGWVVSRETVLLDYHLAPKPDAPRRFVGAFGDRLKGITSQRDRVGFGEMLEFCNRRKAEGRPITGIVVCEQSRHTRQRGWPLLTQIAECLNEGLNVLFAEDGTMADSQCDLSTIMKILLRGESSNDMAVKTAEKTLAALAKLVENGLWPGGNAPPGYVLVDAPEFPAKNLKGCSTRVVKSGDQLHDELISVAFQMPYERGLEATATYLTQKGLRTSPTERNQHIGGPITINILRDTILRNELYCGLLVWPRGRRPRWKSKKRPTTVGYGEKPSTQAYRPELAYVTVEAFEAMQTWLQEQTASRGVFGQKHLLTGILKCPKHKTNLYADGKGWYRCKSVGECGLKGVSADFIENQVYAAIVFLLTEESSAAALVDHFSSTRLSTREKRDQLEADLAVVRRRRSKLLADYGDIDARVDDSAVMAAIKKLEREEARLLADIEICQTELTLSVEALMGLGTKFYLAPVEEKNAMLRSMLRKVRINSKTGLLELQFSELLHNLYLTVKRYILFPPTISASPRENFAAAQAAARLVHEALGGKISRSTRRSYQEKVGVWGQNCVMWFEVNEHDAEAPAGKGRRVRVIKVDGSNKSPVFDVQEGIEERWEREEREQAALDSSERGTCGGGI